MAWRRTSAKPLPKPKMNVHIPFVDVIGVIFFVFSREIDPEGGT